LILEGKIVTTMMMVMKIIFAAYFMMLSQVCSTDSGMSLVKDE
jgi:hypothetical protein